MEAFDDGCERLKSEGPEVLLNSDEAEVIGLALHELSTNCVKYGAWSTSEGTVHIAWGFETSGDARLLRLNWVERGGPPVCEPKRTGFGQTVIKHLVSQKLDASVELVYAPVGLRWSLVFPKDR